VKLDAATGKTLHTYAGSEKTEEIMFHNGMLLTVIGDADYLIEKSDDCHGYWELTESYEPTVDKSIIAYDAKSGKEAWRVTGANLKYLAPLSLRALGEHVFYLDNKQLHCFDAKTGKEQWASPFETEGLFIRSYTPTVVASGDTVLCLKWNRLCAYAIDSGKKLWENKGAIGFGAPGDLFVIGDKVYAIPMTKSIWRESKTNKDGVVTTGINIPREDFLNNAKTAVSLDLKTGKIAELIPFAHTQHHHRCYRNKATQDYLLIGHSGIQVLDLKSKKNETHRWVRGLCQYGIMPANGYLYVPPDTCRCYSSGKINGFFALSETNSWQNLNVEPALEKGPAYAEIENRKSKIENPTDWPTYRGNNARSCSAPCAVPAKPAIKWEAEIGATITAPVVAGGRVFLADRDAYSVHCLDAKDGKAVWKYLANGPIDSPPTIHKGLCVFGCGDGSVYCVDAADGKLAWRFKTSKIERRIGWEDRIESPIRIHGSTLVQNDTVYFAAGYSSNLDGGIRVYGVDLFTGKQRCKGGLASGHWGKDGQWGYLADILVSNGNNISMRNAGFDSQLQKGKSAGLTASTGLLEDAWFHRQGWSGNGGKGQLIAFDGTRSVSVSTPYANLKQSRKGKYQQYNQVGHFHQKFTRYKEEFFPVGTTITARGKAAGKPTAKGKGKKGRAKGKGGPGLWSKEVKLQPRALVIAGDKVLTAGWLDAMVVEVKTGRAKDPANPDPHDAVLRIYSTDKGEQIFELKLPAEPVFDGMAAADGQLFLSMKNGKLACLGE